jgi:hypothetical protein
MRIWEGFDMTQKPTLRETTGESESEDEMGHAE